MASQTVVLNAAGLITSPNELSRTEGALIEASNVLVRRDGIIEQRRGYSLYGSQLPLSNEIVKQLATYRGRILRHYSDKLAFDSNAQGAFLDFAGSFSETEIGLRMKFIEANGNLYFTTSDGIKKVSARTAADFSISDDFIVPAGGVKAVDLDGQIIYTPNSQSGFLPQDSAVAYRVVWAYKDLNGNLIQGAPSQRAVVGNPMIELLIRDYTRLLSTLDGLVNSPLTTARINDGNYIESLGLDLNASASDLRTNLLSLTTKLDNDIIYAAQTSPINGETVPLIINTATITTGVCTITFSSGDPSTYVSAGSKIFLSGFAPTTGTLDGAQVITTVNSTTLTFNTAATDPVVLTSAQIRSNEFRSITQPSVPSLPATNDELVEQQNYISDILQVISLTPATVVSDADKVTTDDLDVTTTATVQLRITIPVGINSNYFYQVYRSSVAQATGANSFEDVVPSDELQQVYEAFPTTVELDASEIVVEDITPDAFRGANLYTNASTGEGILQSNDHPPFAKDINRYRNSVFYANTRTDHNTALNLLGVTQMIADYDLGTTPKVTISNGTTTNTYSFITGQQEITDIKAVADVANSLNSKYFLIDSVDTPYYVYFETTTTVDPAIPNRTGIKVSLTTGDSATIVAQKLRDKLSTYLTEFIPTVKASAARTITGTNTNPGVFTLSSHGFTVNEPIVFTTTGSFSGLTTGTTYYVRSPAASTFQLSLTAGGTSINTTGAQSGVHSVTSVNTVEVVNYEVGEAPNSANGNATGFVFTNTQQGRGERVQPQITSIQSITGASFKSSGTADYFTINTTLDRVRYYVWFARGTATEPVLAGKSGLQVTITGTETAIQAAQKIIDVLPTAEFETSLLGSVITVSNIQYGTTTNATEVVLNAGFTVTTDQVGALDVLLSPLASPARAVDETARSFVRVINKNPGESIYAYYLSGAFDVPGKMLLQARSLQSQDAFYILGNNSNTGLSFNPDIGPEGTITNTAANPTVITTSIAHGMLTGDQVVLSSSNSTPVVDGLWTVTVISPTTFSIPTYVQIAGTLGSFIRATNSLYSENEQKSNRVYFSKYQQPEAVPIVNYFDVGAQDKAILRIFPMRDSLFVFKEDGLYRISGETAPFQLELFDSSFITLAPDSVNIANNIIYAWTTQGIQSLTEGGSAVISRNIDNIILRLQSSNFPNFKTATWALGYESDNSYVVFTVSKQNDTYATIAYRYSTLTESWTTFDFSHACGIINSTDDKMYLGATDVAYIEKEKKTFSRLDYSDREYISLIANNAQIGKEIILPSVTNFAVGDVLVQDQTITVFQFNTMLNKLDLDTGVADTDYNTISIAAGSNPRTALVTLATKLDSDAGVNYSQFVTMTGSKSGTITNISEASSTVITSTAHGLLNGRIILIDSSNSTPSINGTYVATVIDANTFSIPANVIVGGTAGNWQTANSNFEDIKICYNFIMTTLNSDVGVAFSNYSLINNTLQEVIIDSINKVTKKLTVNLDVDFLVGAVTIYKAIESTFTYSPNTMGDPINSKHIREATLMFETRTLTRGIMAFRTDLLPEFKEVPFNLDGNGIFGHVSNFGDGFFGGQSNAAPFRTYIPRQCQRCRFITVKFTHKVAREDYRINGTTLTGETGLSSRAFR